MIRIGFIGIVGAVFLGGICSDIPAYTVPGSTQLRNLQGVPIGGIGGGAFNVQPNGNYNRGAEDNHFGTPCGVSYMHFISVAQSLPRA